MKKWNRYAPVFGAVLQCAGFGFAWWVSWKMAVAMFFLEWSRNILMRLEEDRRRREGLQRIVRALEGTRATPPAESAS